MQTSKGPVVDLQWLVLNALTWGWIALPFVPIAHGVRAWRRTTGVRPQEFVLLLLASASWGWLVLGVFFPWVLGPPHDTQRFATILANLAAMFALTLWTTARARALRWPVTLAALATASLWLYTLVVNSVV